MDEFNDNEIGISALEYKMDNKQNLDPHLKIILKVSIYYSMQVSVNKSTNIDDEFDNIKINDFKIACDIFKSVIKFM